MATVGGVANVTTSNDSRMESINFHSPSGWIREDLENCKEDKETVTSKIREKQYEEPSHEGIVLATMWKGITRYAYINGKERKHRKLNPNELRNFDEISALSSSRLDVEEVIETDIQALRQKIKSTDSRALVEISSNKECQNDADGKTDTLRTLKDRITKRKPSSNVIYSSVSPPRKDKDDSNPKLVINKPKKSPTSVVSIFEEEKKEADGTYSYREYTPPFPTHRSALECSTNSTQTNNLDSVRRSSLFSSTKSTNVDLPEAMEYDAMPPPSSEPQVRNFSGDEKILALKERITRTKDFDNLRRSSLLSSTKSTNVDPPETKESINRTKALDNLGRSSLLSSTKSTNVGPPETMKYGAIPPPSSEPQVRNFSGGEKILALKERIKRKKMREEEKRASLCSESDALQVKAQSTTPKRQQQEALVMCTPAYFQEALKESRRQEKKDVHDPFANKNTSAATGTVAADLQNEFYINLSDKKNKNNEPPTNFSRPWLKDERTASNMTCISRRDSLPFNTTNVEQNDDKAESTTKSNDLLNVSEMMDPIQYFMADVWSLSVRDGSI